MTRTAKSARLSQHIAEPFAEIHPEDAARYGVRAADLVEVSSPHGRLIARALVTRPKLLLMDEPTEGIQPNIIKQIGDVIRHLRDAGQMAIVLVEQYFDFAFGLGDHFVTLERGAVTHDAPSTQTEREVLLKLVSV